MPNAKRVDTLPVAFVFRVTQETLKLNAHYVSYIGMIVKSYFTYWKYILACFCTITHEFLFLIVGLPTEPVLSVGCLQNEECPLYNACRNRKCINPCAEENPCAPTANCKVIRHEPKCTCPDGYIGDPHTDCRPRKFSQWPLHLNYRFSIKY